jgi:hypothetical protein
MSCGTTHKKATTATTAAKPSKSTGKHETLAQRRAISEALKCYYASHGTCKKTSRAAAKKHSAAWYRAHGYHKVKICTAVTDGYSRSVTVTPRNTTHLRRLLWHEIRHAQHLGKLKETRYLIHMGFRKEAKTTHAWKAAAAKAKPRPRNLHASRVSCHTAWRKTYSTTTVKVAAACPKKKSKSRLDGK